MRKTLQTYEKYRDSGFQWLGKIPDHWEVKKFNYIADIVEGQVDPKEHPYQNYILVAPNHIESGTGRLICQETALDQGAISGKYLFQSGDIIYSKIRPALRKVWKAEFPGICSADMYPIRLSKKIIDPRYFTFLCLSESFSGFMIATSMRVAMPKVNRDDFHECHFIIPSITEQKVIAHYLDTKTAQIDRKIDLLTQKAQRYEELKRSLINETVTRGLDKSVPMKDSAIEWIGTIPEHWEVRHLKNAVSVKITDGPHETPDFTDHGVPFISAEAIQNGGINFEAKRGYISEETDKIYSAKCKPQRDDIFIVKSGSTTGKIGYVSTDKNFNIWSPLALVRVNSKHHSRYLYYFLSSTYFQSQVQTYWSLGTQPNIGMKVLEGLFVLTPNFEDQKAIADYLDKKTEYIDRLIANINSQIEIQKELRKTLINDVVTGKIKVA